ncbi:hypothetical protein [Hyphococcus sp.]|uniref:hypothetical protein n=1 Tax=Hyphococcus sp. TaxID=2038636 RepID=UPI00207E9DEE|nr:MAG: hypothetical protein DHS20C04_25550 [Marinicaulis sp.]
MTRATTALSAFIIAIFTFVLPALFSVASANVIEGISVSPTQADVNQVVTISIQKSGATSCFAVLQYGDGQQEDSVLLITPGLSFDHAYASAGTYTITITAEGAISAPCTNGPKTVQIVIGGSGSDPGLNAQIVPQRGGLTRVPAQPSKATVAPDRKTFRYLPKITDHAFVPAETNGSKIWAGPGVLAPGGRLSLKGKGFGESGVIELSGIGPNPVYLLDTQWSETRISGVLPTNLGGAPNVVTPVSVRVLNWQQNKWSPSVTYQYARPFAKRILTMDDPSVRVLSCGSDGNANNCNQVGSVGALCAGIPNIALGSPAPPSPKPTIYGTHGNCDAAIGDDTGTDRYEISLSNGWFIHRVAEKKADNSSGDEEVTFSNVPTGENVHNAQISVGWLVTQGDTLRYWLRIEALGPIGTEPF